MRWTMTGTLRIAAAVAALPLPRRARILENVDPAGNAAGFDRHRADAAQMRLMSSRLF